MITTDSAIDASYDPASLPSLEQSIQSDLDQSKILQSCPQSPIADSSLSAFERRIAGTSLPPPGPLYYSSRRQLWLAQTGHIPSPPAPSTSRQRLEQLLSIPGAATNEEVWKSGVERVWKGLVTGGRLKRRLPMTLVVRMILNVSRDPWLILLAFKIKIIHAGWLRDPETWPADAVAPEPDDVLADSPIFQPTSRMPTELSSGVTSPWKGTNMTMDDGIEASISRQASEMVGLDT